MGCLRGIFFDLDDTLINTTATMEVALRAVQPYLPEQNQNQNTLAEALTLSYHQLWGYGTPGYATLKTLPTRKLRRDLTETALGHLGITQPEQVEKIQAIYEDAERAALAAFPGVHETLRALQPHFQLGIITNGPSILQREKLEQLGLAQYFSTVVADADFGAPKPDPRLFVFAAELLQLHESELMFVGDSLEADIAGASVAGWQSVFVGSKVSPEATFCITKLEELLTLPSLQVLPERKRLATNAKVADTIVKRTKRC